MQRKREILARKYSAEWVARKTDAQVHVIFMKLLSKGLISA